MTHLHREIIAFAVLALLALATIFLAGERGMEAASYQAQLSALEERVAAVEGRPLDAAKKRELFAVARGVRKEQGGVVRIGGEK